MQRRKSRWQTFQSTLPLRGATASLAYHLGMPEISIHAPLTGSDLLAGQKVVTEAKFQSTLPLRGATLGTEQEIRDKDDFNPRSPYGERPDRNYVHFSVCRFQSTLPLRGATITTKTPETTSRNFNPRSPYGERPLLLFRRYRFRPISIHAPLTGSDQYKLIIIDGFDISIHAPLTGSDRYACGGYSRLGHFNPRSPYGERQKVNKRLRFSGNFNPRSPYGERLAWPANVGSKS